MGVARKQAAGRPVAQQSTSAVSDPLNPTPLQGLGQLFVDGLTVSLMGGPGRDDYHICVAFSHMAEHLEAGGPPVLWEAPDETLYEVKKGANYKLRMQRQDGITVYAVPRKGYDNMPALRVRFPARWCRVIPPSHLEEYAVALGKAWGFQCWESFPSRVDIAVDLPVAVDELTSGRWSGRSLCGGAKLVYYGTDGNKLSERPPDDDLATVCNHTGGRKPHTYTIYDKVHQATNNAAARRQIEAYDCPGSSLTRVEFQMRRKGLKKQDIGSCADLTPKKCTKTWSWFTNHVRFEDKSGVTHWWKQVQNAEVHIPRDGPSSGWQYGDLVYDAGARELIDVDSGEVIDLDVEDRPTDSESLQCADWKPIATTVLAEYCNRFTRPTTTACKPSTSELQHAHRRILSARLGAPNACASHDVPKRTVSGLSWCLATTRKRLPPGGLRYDCSEKARSRGSPAVRKGAESCSENRATGADTGWTPSVSLKRSP